MRDAVLSVDNEGSTVETTEDVDRLIETKESSSFRYKRRWEEKTT